MHPAPWGPSFSDKLGVDPTVGPNLDEVGHVLRRDLLSTVAGALGEDLFLPAGFSCISRSKKWEESQPRFNLVSQGLACFFFMMDLAFQLRAAVIVHVELLHTSWRTLHDSLAFSLFVETRL